MNDYKGLILMALIFIGVLVFTSFTSAELIQFDNVKSYDAIEQKVTIENTFGLGRTIADVKLDTPLINYVPRGYQKVAQFTINTYDDIYTNPLEQITFYNKYDYLAEQEKAKTLERQFDYKVLTYENVVIDDYKEVCEEVIQDKNTTQICSYNIIGNHIEQREKWVNIDTTKLTAGKYIIGLYTNVYEDDNVEFIPNFYGVKINEWASWSAVISESNPTQPTTTDTQSSKTGVVIRPLINMTLVSINKQSSVTATTAWIQTSYTNILYSAPFVGDVATFYQLPNLTGNASYYLLVSKNTSSYTDTYSTSATNNASSGNISWVWGVPHTGVNQTGQTYSISGVSYKFLIPDNPPSITLNSPINYFNSSTSTISFNFTGFVYNSGEYIDSVTLYVDNETSETNTTNMINGTTYIISKAISSGFHNWSVSITEANGTTTTSDLRFFNITIYSPDVTLTSPIAYYNTSNPTITFEAEVTDDFGVKNVSLYLDGALNETLISSELISNGYSYQEDADSYICEGIWAGESCETIYDGLWEISTYSDTGNSTIDIIYIKPSDVGNDTKWLIADGLNQGRLNLTIPDSCWSYNSNLSFRITAHNSGDIWYQCYNGDWVTLKWSEVGMEPWEDAVWWENLTLYEFTKTLSEGEHYWSILAYDNDSNPTQSGDRYFTVDLTPPIINVTSPPSNNYRFWLNYTDNQYSTFPYSSYFINWTTIDNFAVDKCWYENISTSLVRTNITITCDENATIVYPVNTGNTLRFFANDTSGNIGSIERTNITNDIRIDRKEHSWINETTEGVSKTFFMFVRKGVEDTLENVNFVFDDVKYPLSTSGLYGWNFTKTIIIPEVTEETETTYYWEFDFGEGFFNSTIYNITIENVVLSEVCNSTYPYYVFNLTLKDEKTQNIINGTIETDISFYPFGNSSILLYEWTSSVNANNTFLCSNLPFNTTDIYKADGAIKYYSDLGTITNYTAMVEYYNFLNYTLIEYNNISLYDINSTEGTEFQLTFKDSSFQTREDILIYVYREYVPEGEFKLVELPKTDSNGQTIVHLVRNDVLYNLIAVDSNGNVLGTLNNVIAFCQDYTIGNCFINFQGTTTTEELTDFWNDVGIRYSLSFDNSTNLISLTFSSLTTDSKEVRMEVISSAIVTNRTLCNTSLTDITGTLTCDVSSIVNTTSSVNVRIFVDGVQKLQDSLSFESSSHSIDGLIFFGFLLLLAIGIFFMESKEGVIIGTIIGLISLIALGVVKGQVVKTGVTSAVIWLIVVGIVLLIKLNGERQ